MTARVLIVKNIQREGPGLFRDVLLEQRVGADVVELDRGDTIPALDEYGALIVLGGPPSANDTTDAMKAQVERTREAIETGLPYLGICLGHQVLGKAAGATVVRNGVKEIGFAQSDGSPYEVQLTETGVRDPLFHGVPESFRVFQLHGEAVEANDDTEVLATGSECPVQAIRVGRRAYGLQMHVEVVPEMLAVWAAQDPDLATFDSQALQHELGTISTDYMRIGRRVLTNFLTIAGLTTAVDLTAEEQAHVH